MNNYLDNFKNIIEDFEKLNQFVFEIANDKRIPENIRDEYVEKYNKLLTHKINK